MLKNILKPGVSFFLRQIIATLLIVIGILITPLPIPVGLIIIALGITVFAYDNRRLVRYLRIFRRKHPTFSKNIEKLERSNIWFFSDIMKKTNPAKAVSTRHSSD